MPLKPALKSKIFVYRILLSFIIVSDEGPQWPQHSSEIINTQKVTINVNWYSDMMWPHPSSIRCISELPLLAKVKFYFIFLSPKISVSVATCYSRLWNEMDGMSMCVKILPAATVILMTCWGVPWHSLQSPPSSPRSAVMIVPNVVNHRVYAHFWSYLSNLV